MNQCNILSTTKTDYHNKRRPADPCILVIFGIAGDLTKRLLFPAICNLGSWGFLNENFCILGISKEPYNTETFRDHLSKNIDEFITDKTVKKYALRLINHVHYIAGDFSDTTVYVLLKNILNELFTNQVSKNCLFYFAVSPDLIETIATQLSQIDLLSENNGNYFRRIVVEKPFGHDLTSAKKLNSLLLSLVPEKQIFRIDHFLGKETVQNIFSFRFSNGIIEPIWNRTYIDHIQITVAETVGVESRGDYYERAGALRDMVPNHLIQMLSLIAMEPPTSFSTENIHAEKAKVTRAIKTYTPEQVLSEVIRGQYSAGKIGDKDVLDYRSEKKIARDSSVETYVALKLFIDNWRWLNVPFYLRTGKRMPIRASEIIVQFKSGPSALFNTETLPNLLHVFIQPDEGISLRINAKVPGPEWELGPVDMKFKYSDYFGIKPQTGYESILYDCMVGDHLLFNHMEMVEAGWAFVQPIIDVWSTTTPSDFPNYAAGTYGPREADDLLHKDCRRWLS